MAKISEQQPLVPSVLDRLMDCEPDNPREAPKSRHQILRELKQSVRRDLENLLNTRWRVRQLAARPGPAGTVAGQLRHPGFHGGQHGYG